MYPVSRMERGFTIVEVAIAVMLMAIILGYSVAMFPVQQELKQYRHAEAEMDEIIEQLIAFAQVNGRLPCPDTSTDAVAPVNSIDGEEDPAGPNDCEAYFGFLPARTLGINGKYDATGTLIDPWGSGYGYAVSPVDAGNGDLDLVTANGIRDEGIPNVLPDLFICDDNNNAVGNDTDCTTVSGAEVLGTNGEVAAVIISLGKDFVIPATSNIQAENLDDFNDGSNDKVYIFSGRRDDYDDIVKWLPTNLLISRMIAAEQLP